MKRKIILLLLMVPLITPIAYGDPVPRDFYLETSKGTIDGHSSVHKFGHNPSVGTSWEHVWDNGTIYSFLTSATKFNISSTDVDDVGATEDTGAWNLTIYGLDANYALQNEVVQLNGQNGVLTANTYIRVYKMIVEESGSTETNEGDIYCGTGAITGGIPTSVYAEIKEGDGQTLMAIYTVPAGYTGFMINIHYTSDEDKAVEFALFARPSGGSWNIKDRIYLYRSPFNMDFDPPRKFSEKTDVTVQARVGTGTTRVSAAFRMILVEDAVVDTSVLNWEDGESSTLQTRDPTVILAMILGLILVVLILVGSRR